MKVANFQKVHIMFFVVGIRTWDSSIPGSSAVTVVKRLKADVLEDDHGNGSKLSKVNILLSDIEVMLDLANVIQRVLALCDFWDLEKFALGKNRFSQIFILWTQ